MSVDRRDGWRRRAYRLLLLCYPPDFRNRHGEEMLRVFLERRADVARTAGFAGLARFWVGAAADAVRSGWAERRTTDRRSGGGGGMDSLMKDLRYAARTLLRSPGFAVVAVATIALGIGANTAIFSVVRAVLLAPLPYADGEDLVVVWSEMRARGVTNFPHSPPDFRDIREQADLLQDLGATFTFPAALTGDEEAEQVQVGFVTPNLFSMLGVEPVLGRGFVPEDGTANEPGIQPGAPGSLPNIALLGHAVWQRRYGSDPNVVGRTVELAGASAEIVGVMPPGFELLLPPAAGLADRVDVWVAARLDYDNAPRNNVFLRAIGRLADGATVAQLQTQLDRIAAGIREQDPSWATAGYALTVENLHADLTADVRPVLLALLGAVAFVLLIACANVSNLLLVRAARRERELAVRSAMGGSRARIVRQLLIESGMLALVGAALGLVVARGGIALLLALQPDDLPRIASVRIDGTVLAFTVLAAGGAALVFGLLPAMQASRLDLVDALKERGAVAAGEARRLLRNAVVVAEVALSLVLLIGAGLMVRSFVSLTRVEPGYVAEGVLTFGLPIPFGRYPEPIDRANLQRRIQERIRALPGVESVGGAFPLPLQGELFNGRYGSEEALADASLFRQAAYRAVLPGYFEATGSRLVAGRVFTDADNTDSTRYVVVDDLLAERLWPGRSGVGERFLIRAVTPEPDWVEVIGVVEHQRSETLAADGMETVYLTDKYLGSFGNMKWTVRAGVPPLSLVSAIRAEVQQVDPDLPLADVRLLTEYVDDAMGGTRFALTLIGVFGILALVLATIGLYGVLSYAVRQRTAEIGVRMAFGAEGGQILRMVVRQGLVLAGAGVGLGLVAAFPLTRMMESLVVGVAPTDPLTFAAVSALFVLVAALACYLPARRATRVDPVAALREG